MTNPADFYLETLSVDTSELEASRDRIRVSYKTEFIFICETTIISKHLLPYLQTYCDIFAKSSYNKALTEAIEQIPIGEFDSINNNYLSYNSTLTDQMHYLLNRSWLGYFKNYHVFLVDLFMAIVSFIQL